MPWRLMFAYHKHCKGETADIWCQANCYCCCIQHQSLCLGNQRADLGWGASTYSWVVGSRGGAGHLLLFASSPLSCSLNAAQHSSSRRFGAELLLLLYCPVLKMMLTAAAAAVSHKCDNRCHVTNRLRTLATTPS